MKRFIQIIYVILFAVFTISNNCATISASPKNWSVGLSITNFDGLKYDVKPGDTISIEAGNRDHLRFANIHGDSLNYVVFINKGGLVNIGTYNCLFAIQVWNCSFYRLTGTGTPGLDYGIRLWHTPSGSNTLAIDDASTNYEIDHLEITGSGFAGICANPKPDCADRLNRGNFVQRNTIYHDNYIHGVRGEGFYLGHSFYTGYTITCDSVQKRVYPHEIHGLKVYNNIVDSAGYDGIQVGCATQDCFIFGNKVTNYGARNVKDQNFGIIISAGTGGDCFNNFIQNGTGNGINVFGIGGNKIYNNIIINPGKAMNDTMVTSNAIGIFCDDRCTTPGTSFYFLNNTIISPKGDGIRIFSDDSYHNMISNNLILNPGSYGTYNQWVKPNTCYVNVKTGVDVTVSNNYYSNTIDNTINFNNAETVYDYCKNLAIIDQGLDVSPFGIVTDYYNQTRQYNGTTDIGAFEYPLQPASQQMKTIRVIPQPSDKSLLVYSEDKAIINNIKVYEISGQLVGSYKPNTNEYNISLNAEQFKGVYLVHADTNNAECRSKICLNF